MNIWSLVQLAMWFYIGLHLLICSAPKFKHHQLTSLFGITNRRGLSSIGVVFTLFVVFKIYQWQIGPNPSIIWSM